MMDRYRHHRAQSGREVSLPCEVAIALSYNGSTQAVMMATPADLHDFAHGFSLTEGIATRAEIESVTVQETDLGIDLQIWLTAGADVRLASRRRTMAGPVGCGLCGIDSLEQAVRTPARVPRSDLHLTPAMITQAVRDMGAHQPLHDLTRATHAAAYWVPGQGCVALREDVGRHNALDKLVGAVSAGGCPAGAVVITSRVSIDMVQKCAALGAPVLIAVAAPTAAAVAMADLAGITLVALARGNRYEVFSHPDRISTKDVSDVA